MIVVAQWWDPTVGGVPDCVHVPQLVRTHSMGLTNSFGLFDTLLQIPTCFYWLP